MLEEEEEEDNDVTRDEGILLDVADSEEGTDSNKVEDESMESSFPVKSEVFDNDENDEKHDAEKDIDIAELLHTEGDIKLEDLEEENDMNQSTPEVGLFGNSCNFCLFIIVVIDPEIAVQTTSPKKMNQGSNTNSL